MQRQSSEAWPSLSQPALDSDRLRPLHSGAPSSPLHIPTKVPKPCGKSCSCESENFPGTGSVKAVWGTSRAWQGQRGQHGALIPFSQTSSPGGTLPLAKPLKAEGRRGKVRCTSWPALLHWALLAQGEVTAPCLALRKPQPQGRSSLALMAEWAFSG